MRAWSLRACAWLVCTVVATVAGAGAVEAQDPQQAAPADASDADDDGGSVAPYILMATGGALLIGATATGFLALSKQSELDDVCGPEGVCPTVRESEAERGETLATTTDVLLATGVAILGVGLVVWLLNADDESGSEGVSASVGCGPAGCGAAMHGRF